MSRIYAIFSSWGPKGKVEAWAESRFGDAEDPEIRNAIKYMTKPGDGRCFTVTFSPDQPKLMKPEHVRNLRIRNMQRRAQKQPLFAEEIEQSQMQREYFSMDAAEKAQKQRTQTHDKWTQEWHEDYSEDKKIKLEHIRQSSIACSSIVIRPLNGITPCKSSPK
jgi:hypothetical protein